MLGLDLLIPFLFATAAFAYFPGPALLYTAAQTMAFGKRAGLLAALGIHLGGYVHVAAAALGLSAVFRYVPELYTALKIVGALYLIWLGIGILRGSRAKQEEPTSVQLPVFYQSMLVEILNPKVAVFFIAFLPQFVDPAALWPLAAQFFVLGVFVNLAFSSADLLAVFLTTRVMGLLRGSNVRLTMARWLSGTILIGLGAKLALTRN